MKGTLVRLKAAAGAIGVAALLAALAPFNMGGCGDAGKAITDAAGALGGGAQSLGSGVGGVGGSAGNNVQRSVTALQGASDLVQALSLSDEEERALGECVALSGADRYGVVDDDGLNGYVTMVAQTIADATPVGGRPVAFVLASDDVNAYSGPTGYIMVTRGLLNRLEDESELAGVLAHEMGHVVEHHGLNAVGTSKAAAGLQKIGQAAAGRQAGVANLGGDLAKFILGTPYSQGQERQADADAVRFMSAAGYDPQGYAHALERLHTAGADRGGGMSTHPGTADRIKVIRSEIERLGTSGGQTNRDRFQSAVRGGGSRVDGQ